MLEKEAGLTPQAMLASARTVLQGVRGQMAEALVARIAALQYLESGVDRQQQGDLNGRFARPTLLIHQALLGREEAQHTVSFDPSIQERMFGFSAEMAQRVTLKQPPQFASKEAAQASLRVADAALIQSSHAVSEISLDVKHAKEALNPSAQDSYIVPVVEEKVYGHIFSLLADKMHLDAEAKSDVTQWYRHSVAGSLMVQQPMTIAVHKGDAQAKAAAQAYLPGHQVEEIPRDVSLFVGAVQGPSHIAMMNTQSYVNQLHRRGLALEPQTSEALSVVTPFPEYSPNRHVGEGVRIIARIPEDKLAECDRQQQGRLKRDVLPAKREPAGAMEIL